MNTTPVCTSATDSVNGRLVECEAPLVSAWMETVTCERGHVERFVPARWADSEDESDGE